MTLKLIKARCPICLILFEYPECGYKPKTCSNADCVHKYLHPEINKERK